MSRKIIGITVGTQLPKPNFDQTDPSKGDYIKGDRSFLNSVRTVNGVSPDANGNVSVELDDAVLYSKAQTLTDEQKAQARDNIGAGDLRSSDLPMIIEDTLSQAKESGDFDGENGKDGVSVTHSWSGTTLSVTSASGTSSANLKGNNGDSLTVVSVQASSEDGGENIITLSDGSTLIVTNGNTGATGAAGKDGNGVKSAVLNSNYTLTLTFDDGTSYTTPSIRGAAGKDGSSVSIVSMVLSSEDGGENVITFSDGTELVVANGRTGGTGPIGPVGPIGPSGPGGLDGYTPVKGVDYYTDGDKAEFEAFISTELAKRGQLKPEFANSTADCTDTSKLYVLPDGNIYAHLRHEETVEGGPNFTNLLKASTTEIKTNTRYSQSSAAFKTGVSNVDAVIIPIPSGSITLRFRGISYGVYSTSDYYPYIYGGKSNSNFTTTTFVSGVASWTPGANGDIVITFNNTSGCTHAVMHLDHAKMSTGIVTLNEEITYTEGGTVVTEEWASTGHAFVPADYEDRIIELEETAGELTGRVNALENNGSVAAIRSMIYAPSPQLPADGSDTADFDAENINANEIYAYIDELVEKHPRYLTKETLGKDASGNFDWNRYTASRRTYDAWVTTNYPAMYGWTNGSTTIYSVSVSPRVGDTMYSTTYVGTAYSTVTAVSNANQTRTVSGKVFTRNAAKDVAPTLVYTWTYYDPRKVGIYTNWNNEVYNSSRSKIATISSIANGVMTDSAGKTHKRYPMGDRNSNFAKLPVLVIGSNEHGGNSSGDPTEPAIITARLIKDLCGREHADNAFLNMLKTEYLIVFCPVINPWGFGNKASGNVGYCNANGVNIDRNFDTPGWGNDADTRHGAYGGSEPETQYFMNTLMESGTKIAMANHGFGPALDSSGEVGCAGMCGYMLGEDLYKYNAHLAGIRETMIVDYELTVNNVGQAPASQYGKTRSYINHIGAEGGALEMCPVEGFLLHGGKLHGAKILEANYTMLLQFLNMLIECQG